jgi:hypothetical protein
LKIVTKRSNQTGLTRGTTCRSSRHSAGVGSREQSDITGPFPRLQSFVFWDLPVSASGSSRYSRDDIWLSTPSPSDAGTTIIRTSRAREHYFYFRTQPWRAGYSLKFGQLYLPYTRCRTINPHPGEETNTCLGSVIAQYIPPTFSS